ncbi:hypothetical protein LO763_11970 [Glycomyces sp. A-F 0318]|uniref:hypothetical protein n=1 Tax=Glycomyces amatae TaxID=2881355 RepID=UPI001E31A6E6|nr:hypothetical protein [Glycomyces amatae]
MELKRKLAARGALGLAAAAAGLIGSLVLASPAQAEDTTIHLKEQHRGQTADSNQFPQICGEDEHIPADKPADYDGWVFNYPGSSQYDTEILVLTAEFLDQDGGTHVLTTDTDGFTINDTGTLKAYIGAPAGWTLVDAQAQLAGADHTWKPTFVVTHTCPGSPGEENPTSPGEESTSPGEESPTGPGEEATTPGEGGTVPGEASTSPAAGLPTTGTPLTIAIVSAAALAAAGAALFMVQRRRREARDW